MSGRASYAGAGVDVEAGERAVEALRPHAEKAVRPEVLTGIGGFAGLFAPRLGRYREPVLAASTDGVGTKVAVAQAVDKHDTIGLDLVAMVVDDLVVCGAEPLFLQDYIAVGKVVPEQIATIVSGIAEGCRRAGCALLGGETAEHPGLMQRGSYDLSATGVGIVDADAVLRPERVRAGDVLVAMAASGLHSNGYSLARHVLLDIGRMPLHGHVEEFGRTLGEELLIPTRIYARDCLAVIAETDVRTFAHITGGGLAAQPGARAAARRGGRGRARHVDAGARVRPDRGPRPGGAGGDGEDVQHGRRHGGRAAPRRRRPRAGGPDRAARAGVGARLGAPRRGDACARRRAGLTGPAARRPPALLTGRQPPGPSAAQPPCACRTPICWARSTAPRRSRTPSLR